MIASAAKDMPMRSLDACFVGAKKLGSFTPAALGLLIATAAPSRCLAQARHPLIVLPANTSEATVNLVLATVPATADAVTVTPILSSGCAACHKRALGQSAEQIVPQPQIAERKLVDKTLQLRYRGIFFWGRGVLFASSAQAGNTDGASFLLQRGPEIASGNVRLGGDGAGDLWLYNYDQQPLTARWRILSGHDTACASTLTATSDSNVEPDCEDVSQLPQVTLGPGRSDRLTFVVPPSWFDAWDALSDMDRREAELELRFGTDASAPVRRWPLSLHFQGGFRNALMQSVPGWLASGLGLLGNLLWVMFWVTLGAVVLMLAQVMIPNFRKCLRLEGQVENLRERLRAIGSGVGGSLYTRCERELQGLLRSLGMDESNAKAFWSWDRLALSGNSAEVNRLTATTGRIESRIRLTELLDARRSIEPDLTSADLPPTLSWNREQQLRSIQATLARQFVSEAEEKTISSALDALADSRTPMKDFEAQLEARLSGLQRQLAKAPRKLLLELIKDLPGCTDLLNLQRVEADGKAAEEERHDAPDRSSDGVSTPDELVHRDLIAIRLAIVSHMIDIAPLLESNPETRDSILEKLKSSDPATLAEARADLLELSQGISEADIVEAFQNKLWDLCSEPLVATDQDIVRASLQFRNRKLNGSMARDAFRCCWRISTAATPDPTDSDVWEEGWTIHFLPPRGDVTVSIEVYDAKGQESFKPAAKAFSKTASRDESKGVLQFSVTQPPGNAVNVRVVRGLIDAVITALVPVLTVALTQVQNGGNVGVDKLVLLGFTSQAIRAAVVPESVSGPVP